MQCLQKAFFLTIIGFWWGYHPLQAVCFSSLPGDCQRAVLLHLSPQELLPARLVAKKWSASALEALLTHNKTVFKTHQGSFFCIPLQHYQNLPPAPTPGNAWKLNQQTACEMGLIDVGCHQEIRGAHGVSKININPCALFATNPVLWKNLPQTLSRLSFSPHGICKKDFFSHNSHSHPSSCSLPWYVLPPQTASAMGQHLSFCEGLTHLSFCGYTFNTPGDITNLYLVIKGIPNLAHLSLPYSKFKAYCAPSFALQEFKRFMKALQGLSAFSIKGTVSEKNVLHMGHVAQGLGGLPHLTHLDVSETNLSVPEGSMALLGERLTGLRLLRSLACDLSFFENNDAQRFVLALVSLSTHHCLRKIYITCQPTEPLHTFFKHLKAILNKNGITVFPCTYTPHTP